MQQRSVGASVPRLEGVLKVTGQARFGADEAVPGMLWCAFVRSPLPHARITRIDVSRAETVAGVHAVLTGHDIPLKRWGRRLQDVPVLAVERVRFVGEKVAAVAAETRAAAEEAARLVEVEYDELPAVFDAESALRGDVLIHDPSAEYEDAPASWGKAPNVQSWVTLQHGDAERAFADADHASSTNFAHSRCTRGTSSRMPI
jgi:CO/xanthine dehydrogenase Mo-binding subunit